MMQICASKLSFTSSDNGLSPSWQQAIIWTNAGILLSGALGTNFSEIIIKIDTFSFKKIHSKMPPGKWQPFWLSLNVVNWSLLIHNNTHQSTNRIVCIILGVYLYMPFSQDMFIAMKSKQFSIQQQIHAKKTFSNPPLSWTWWLISILNEKYLNSLRPGGTYWHFLATWSNDGLLSVNGTIRNIDMMSETRYK